MGRWAQRRRGGGSGGTVAPVQMTSVQTLDPTHLLVTYSGSVNAAAFSNTDFETLPDEFNPSAVVQGDPDTIGLTILEGVGDQTDLRYIGDAPGVVTPQELPIIP